MQDFDAYIEQLIRTRQISSQLTIEEKNFWQKLCKYESVDEAIEALRLFYEKGYFSLETLKKIESLSPKDISAIYPQIKKEAEKRFPPPLSVYLMVIAILIFVVIFIIYTLLGIFKPSLTQEIDLKIESIFQPIIDFLDEFLANF